MKCLQQLFSRCFEDALKVNLIICTSLMEVLPWEQAPVVLVGPNSARPGTCRVSENTLSSSPGQYKDCMVRGFQDCNGLQWIACFFCPEYFWISTTRNSWAWVLFCKASTMRSVATWEQLHETDGFRKQVDIVCIVWYASVATSPVFPNPFYTHSTQIHTHSISNSSDICQFIDAMALRLNVSENLQRVAP